MGRGSVTLIEEETFSGFPSSGLATAVPNLFFSRLLPQIESAEELIVSVYFFFAQGQKRRSPRFLTQRELEADAALVRSLSRICEGDGGEPLRSGLRQALQRGTLVRATLMAGRRRAERYCVS